MRRKPSRGNTSLLFLVDENLPFSIVSYLESNNHDVLDVAATPLRGSPDKALWARAAADGRVIVTRDLDFPIPGLKPYPAGVILLRVPPDYTAMQITEVFTSSFSKMAQEELFHNVAVFSPGRIRIRPLP